MGITLWPNFRSGIFSRGPVSDATGSQGGLAEVVRPPSFQVPPPSPGLWARLTGREKREYVEDSPGFKALQAAMEVELGPRPTGLARVKEFCTDLIAMNPVYWALMPFALAGSVLDPPIRWLRESWEDAHSRHVPFRFHPYDLPSLRTRSSVTEMCVNGRWCETEAAGLKVFGDGHYEVWAAREGEDRVLMTVREARAGGIPERIVVGWRSRSRLDYWCFTTGQDHFPHSRNGGSPPREYRFSLSASDMIKGMRYEAFLHDSKRRGGPPPLRLYFLCLPRNAYDFAGWRDRIAAVKGHRES